MKFSEFFDLDMQQVELDFVDVDVPKDLPVYVDPFAIELCADDFASRCNQIMRQFFQELLTAIQTDDLDRINHLVSNFHEPSDTFLGVSEGGPGRGMGDIQTQQLVAALRASDAVKSGRFEQLSESTLFIDGIGRDKISDLTTNLIREVLVDYTLSQCELHGIDKISKVPSAAPLWNQARATWANRYVELPIVDERPVLLVPKYFVRRDISLMANDFYRKVQREYLKAEHTRPGDSLAHVIKKTGELKVYYKDIEEKYPLDKAEIFKFCSEHPHLLAQYKNQKKTLKALTLADFEEGFSEMAYAKALGATLDLIPVGRANADKYHSFCIGILTFLFYPYLVTPIKEAPQNDGRKRIDIRFRNNGIDGFFGRVANWANTHASLVPVECKNYGKEIGNPEIDQLIGRFDANSGKFGMLFCRSISNKRTMIQRQKDAAKQGLGYPFVFDDDDLKTMLSSVAKFKRLAVDTFLNERLDAICG